MSGRCAKLMLAAGAAAALWASGCSRTDPLASGAADQAERIKAVRELGREGSDAAVAQLGPLLAHEDPRTALEACGALGRSGRPQAARALATALSGDRRRGRVARRVLAGGTPPVCRGPEHHLLLPRRR